MTPGEITAQKWRPAGPLSHQRSAAAAALIVQTASSGFAGVADSWTGALHTPFILATHPRNAGLVNHYWLIMVNNPVLRPYCRLGYTVLWG